MAHKSRTHCRRPLNDFKWEFQIDKTDCDIYMPDWLFNLSTVGVSVLLMNIINESSALIFDISKKIGIIKWI